MLTRLTSSINLHEDWTLLFFLIFFVNFEMSMSVESFEENFPATLQFRESAREKNAEVVD